MKDKRLIPHTAENDLTHSMAHYLLTIHKLKEEKGYARVTDIARELNLTKGSVSTALSNLKKRNLVHEEDESKFLSLSQDGHNEVHKILSSRTLLFYFLRDFVGVSDAIAHNDSCLMEHLLSEETREKFFIFMKTIACSCKEESQLGQMIQKFQTTLDLCKFDDPKAFFEGQKGDIYLAEEE